MDSALVAAIGVAVGAVLAAITKAVIDFAKTRATVEQEESDHSAKSRRDDYTYLTRQHRTLIEQLQSQILDLSKQVRLLQDERVQCLEDNAQLKAQILLLQESNAKLQEELESLIQRISKLEEPR